MPTTSGIMVRDFRATTPDIAAVGVLAFRDRFGREPENIYVSKDDPEVDCLSTVMDVPVVQVSWIRPHCVMVAEYVPPAAPAGGE